MSKRKETIINFLIGFFSQLVILVFGLIVPKVILSHYGSDTNGLMTSITQVFAYVALLESGISLATRNALYKPLVENKQNDVNAILSSSRHHYRIAAYCYAGIVVILSIVLPFILKTSVDYWTIFFIVFFEGMTSAFSFYFVDVDICFLNTVGKTYIVNIMELVYRTAGFAVKIILALNGINIAFIQVGFFVNIIIKILFMKLYIKKKYPWVKNIKSTVPLKLKDRQWFLITEIAWVIFSSTDMIVLSIFLSTELSSVYSIYNMIFVALNALINAVYTALSYNLGKVFHEDIEKYKRLHNIFNSFIMSITTILICVAFWLTLPFVKLYTEGADINYIYPWLPLLFSAVQMLSWSRYVSGNLTSVAGYVRQTSYISLVEAILNIGTSIALVLLLPYEYAIYGVLLATVFALPLKVIFTHCLSEKVIMKRKPWKTILIIGINYLIFAVTAVLQYFIPLTIESYWKFILYGFMFVGIYTVVVLLLNFLVNKDTKDIIKLFKRGNKEKAPSEHN